VRRRPLIDFGAVVLLGQTGVVPGDRAQVGQPALVVGERLFLVHASPSEIFSGAGIFHAW
jgi:hypothetical protein